MIFWNGISSDDVHVIVEHYPNRPIPERKIEVLSVPNRNGDILYSEDAFNNYTQQYDIYISADEGKRLPMYAKEVASWLSVKGYARLEDGYDIDVYREAYYSGPVDIENILNRFGRATIMFNCKPQRFYRTGEREISVVNGSTIINPTKFVAKPLIHVEGEGAGTVGIGGRTIAFTSLNHCMIDCETMDAYWNGTNKNNTIVCSEFPVLNAGSNAITVTGLIDSVTITPRWWSL